MTAQGPSWYPSWLLGPRGRLPGLLWTFLLALPLVLFLVLFSAWPLLNLSAYAFENLGGLAGFWSLLWGAGLSSQVARNAMENSAIQGSLSAAIAMAWGYPVGVYLGRQASKLAKRIRTLLLIPFILPSLVMVFGVYGLFAEGGLLGKPLPELRFLSYGLPGILLVNVLYNSPVVALYTATALDKVPKNLEEAATLLGASRFMVFKTVWLRPSLLGASLGGVLTFIFCFLSFAPPLLIGGPSYYTMEDWIYALDKLVGFNGLATACGLAVWALIVLTLPLIAYLWLSRGTNLLGRGAGTLSRSAKTTGKYTPLGYVLFALTLTLVSMEALLLASVVLLSVGLPWGTPGLSSWILLFSSRVGSILQVPVALTAFNTVFFALTAAALVFGLVLPLQVYAKRDPGRWEGLTFLPLLISPVILALGLSLAWGSTLGSSSTVWVLIVISQASIGLPFALQGLSLSLRAQPPSLSEAAMALGASRFRALSDVRLPIARAGLWTALLFTLAIGLGEFAATNFLYVPHFATLVVAMYLLEEIRSAGGSYYAIGALLVIISIVLFLMLSYFAREED